MKCSFCIVPATRGREVSRPLEELVAEIERLAADGVREVTLLGQNVNSYGRDLPKESRIGFSELLARVDAIGGIERIRYTSPHPKDMKEDVIRAHAELPALCEQIHLPLQSGSSAILKRMRRTYDRQRYMDRVALIREHVPDCAITTDIIVGFPGETEADFEQTLEVVDEVGYDGAFTFIFSPRRETEAADFGEQVPHPVKRERMERLVDLVQRRATERAQRFVGREMEVLVEGPSRTDPTRLRGRTRHNKTVNFDGAAEPGELVRVEIHSATSTTLSGVAAKPVPVWT
jgi:tRNA-2-methylthio-N6-dimethylallyladenosine synthase